MSADTRPISPGRFAAAVKDLSISTLHLKVLEIRNSIAHLQYSNDQLKPFAEGSATALGGANDGTDAVTREPDQDCIDAIKENEVVIDRMAERIAIIRAEVEERGVSWTEFQSKEEAAAAAAEREKEAAAAAERRVNGHGQETHSAWTDGTFQTGTIRNGQVHMDNTSVPPTGRGGDTGGRLNDEELRRALEERMRDLGTDGDDDDGGMHL